MTTTSWTPEKIKDLAAVKRRNACIGWGVFCYVVAYGLAGLPGSGFYLLGTLVAGSLMFYAASKINIWKTKRAEGAVYK